MRPVNLFHTTRLRLWKLALPTPPLKGRALSPASFSPPLSTSRWRKAKNPKPLEYMRKSPVYTPFFDQLLFGSFKAHDKTKPKGFGSLQESDGFCKRQTSYLLLAGAVEHPPYSELILAGAEISTPEHFLEGHLHFSSFRQLLK